MWVEHESMDAFWSNEVSKWKKKILFRLCVCVLKSELEEAVRIMMEDNAGNVSSQFYIYFLKWI